MAASTWTTTKGASGIKYHTTTVSTTDGSAILPVDPRSNISLTINWGGTDALSYRISNADTPAAGDMVSAATAIGADYSDGFVGGVTALDFDSDGTASHVINVLEIPFDYGKN